MQRADAIGACLGRAKRFGIAALTMLALAQSERPGLAEMDMDRQLQKDELSVLLAADTHYGQEQWTSNEAGNKEAIAAMNAIADQQLPLFSTFSSTRSSHWDGREKGPGVRMSWIEI